MTGHRLRYDLITLDAMRGMMATILKQVADNGLPGGHHFYITFRTADPGVVMPDGLRAKHPGDMTIVLQHRFWNLAVSAGNFSVRLAFDGQPETLTIPFSAITAFQDPSVGFGLKFEARAKRADAKPVRTDSPGVDGDQVVSLDSFRKDP